jgi:hypothetical protein
MEDEQQRSSVKPTFKVIDNLFEQSLADEIENVMIGNTCFFPWYYNLTKTHDEQEDYPDNYQFTHTFYRNHKVSSDYFDKIILPFTHSLNIASLLRVKANLNPRTPKRVTDIFHVDLTNFAGKTAVYYVNSNDGQTILESGEKISSVKNRVLIFDSNLRHTGTTCTNKKVRCLINFNYTEWNSDVIPT